jgi:hypothetical protein
MSQLTSADYAPQAPPAVLTPVKPHERDESLVVSAAINVGLVFLVTAFVVLLAVAAFLAVFVVLSAFAPS